MELSFLGGAMEIGGSCIYLRIAGKGILMDSGIRQSGGKDPLPDFRTIQQMGGLDAIIISHAHMDHIGTLPIISRSYPTVPVYMTAMTADLVRVLLYDSLKVMERREEEIPHYTEKDVLSMLNRIVTFGFNTPHKIFENFTLTFYPAGHIAGAACIYLVTEEGSLFYSGDFSSFAQRTIEGIRIPRLRPDVSIVETTYGNRLHANRQTEERRLVNLIGECLQKKHKILIPAFALGRAQEVLLILRSAIQNGELPAVPVYVDGMVRDINTMYIRNPLYLKNALGKRILKGNEPFYTKEIQPVAVNQKREELMEGSDPAIFVSSSGMLTGGPSVLYAKKLISMEHASIIITGYQDEESPGRKLLNLLENPDEKTITLDGTTIPVRCGVHQVGLSAHGDQSEIMALLNRLESRNIFLVHGNRDVIDELGAVIASEDYRKRVYLPECGQTCEILIGKKRKQLSQIFPHTLQKDSPFTVDDEKLLWAYWREYYPEKIFSVAQIAQIWYGKAVSDETILQDMQNIFLKSIYFSPDPRRMFLFCANPEEAVKQAEAPKTMTIQELEKQVQLHFGEFPYKKISYHVEVQEIILIFDYPDSQDTGRLQAAAEKFREETGWTISINPSMNHNAAGVLLYGWFENRLMKTSYFQERKEYAVTLSSMTEEDAGKIQEFRKMTGWKLVINGISDSGKDSAGTAGSGVLSGSSELSDNGMDFFRPQNDNAEQVEQNLAFSCIDQTFEGQPCTLYRKGIKNDGEGKFLEFSFISPALGRRYRQLLQTLSDQIGWRIRIADKVNQAELIKIAGVLCSKYGITVCKNPSYLPGTKEIQLTILPGTEESVLTELAAEFKEKTGCGCGFKVR
ncbi:MAG: MBL fold metallo-hydrolase [Lachnospiraceae bacterium]